ncbi:hypothetical protein PF008_g31308 [Phytophthora fragariae]|uniref:Uncharacterized protein n=2 Tax=Phytophthora fragariae TaxID=53985 RepID=A0A6G0Q351_9STRA|nr:hypothetical protein PF003_g13035 [Phytophthora fragariae]KAE9267655.1 hypothetical protein PF008_g31308 [Phytophthora fragariae]
MNGPAPLLAVRLLFRSKAEFSSLPHVADAVSLFLDSSVDLPLHKACKTGSQTLLNRIWSSSEIFAFENKDIPENPSWTLRRYIRTDRFYRRFQLRFSLIESIRLKNVEMVRWLLDKFQGVDIDRDVLLQTMATISIEVLQIFYDYDRAGHQQVEWDEGLMAEAIFKGRQDVIWWLHQNLPNQNFDRSEALMLAVRKGDIVMAEWLIDNGGQWGPPFPGYYIGHDTAA